MGCGLGFDKGTGSIVAVDQIMILVRKTPLFGGGYREDQTVSFLIALPGRTDTLIIRIDTYWKLKFHITTSKYDTPSSIRTHYYRTLPLLSSCIADLINLDGRKDCLVEPKRSNDTNESHHGKESQ
jgi:hypothetical protein